MEAINQVMTLGTLLWDLGKVGEARKIYERSLVSAGELVARDDQNTTWLRHLAIIHNVLGRALRGGGDFVGAVEHFEASIGIFHELVELEPENINMRRRWASGQVALGKCLLAQDKTHEALPYLRAGLATLSEAALGDAGAEAQRQLISARLALSQALLALGQRKVAQAQASEAFDGIEPQAEENPENLSVVERMENARILLGLLEQDPSRARSHWEKAADVLEFATRKSRRLELFLLRLQVLELLGRTAEAGAVRADVESLQRKILIAAPLGA